MSNQKQNETFQRKLNYQNRPFIHIIQSDCVSCVLDLHTNRIFSIDEYEKDFFINWMENKTCKTDTKKYQKWKEDVIRLQSEGMFSSIKPEKLAFGWPWEKIQDALFNERERTVIEITQKCNLRCKYCTFGGGFIDHRNHSSLTISLITLKKTILQAIECGKRLNEISISFYGGEPLIAFNLIKFAVNFAKSESNKKNIRFSLTTNATLIDVQKAQFFKDNNFNLLISLDGPEFMHNQYRVFPNGSGSYAATIKGLKILLDVYTEQLYHKIALNMVVPSYDWIPYLDLLWENEPWLPRTIRAQTTLADLPSGFSLVQPQDREKLKTYYESWLNDKNLQNRENTLKMETYDKSMAKLHKRLIFDSPRNFFFPNGCCIPGVRKLYVCADGSYQLCERVHGVPKIGSVQTGIDLPAIKKIIDEYNSLSFSDCTYCFAISNCSLCFQHAFESGKFNIQKKREACELQKRDLSHRLEMYSYISKYYPNKLDFWDTYEFY